jgi:hypothetical protein
MKRSLWLILPLIATLAWADTVSTPTPTPLLPGKWNAAKVPWSLWFKNNALVTDKTQYVHFFWNANDFKANFETKDRKQRLADAAVQLVAKLYPKGSKADLVKVDIVYVLERDDYGLPKWDSLQQVVHLEFLRSRLAKLRKVRVFTDAVIQKSFQKFEVY